MAGSASLGSGMREPIGSVALVGAAPPLRGISGYCIELARHLSERIDVRFVSFRSMYPAFLYPGGDPGGDTTFPEVESPTLSIDRRLAWYAPWGWLHVARGIRADVVHLQHWSLPVAPVLLTVATTCARHGRPTVVTLHNVLPHEPSRADEWMTRLIARRARRCIVHSASNRDEAVRHLGIPSEKIDIVPHGPLEFLDDSPVDPVQCRDRLGLGADDEVVLFFGAIRPYKGLDVLLDAVARLGRSRPRLRLLIAGQPWGAWDPWARRIADLGLTDRVIAVPEYVPSAEVKIYFRSSDVVALPYVRFGAASGVGMAAVSFARPVVVTRVADLPALAQDPHCVAAPGDADELASAIDYVLSDPTRRAALGAAVAAVEQGSWDKAAERTMACYRDAMMP